MKLSSVVACDTVTLYPNLGASDSLGGSVPFSGSLKAKVPRRPLTRPFQVLGSMYVMKVDIAESKMG